jgi:hypothetical protein
MTPRQYEESVGEFFRKLGYKVEITPLSNDYGVDIFAWKGGEKHAIQAKMYGKARKINRQCVMELCGAKQYFDCDHAVIVTNGKFLPDAIEVAKKLDVQIIYLEESAFVNLKNAKVKGLTFDELWEKYILPLEGKTLTKANGESNTILACDWGGIERITSNGKPGKIKIEIFRTAINQLLSTGSITRDEINQNYTGRASSGVILILSQIPFFKIETNPLRLTCSKSKS